MAEKVFDEYLAKTELDNLETDGINTQTKKVSLYGFDTSDLTKKRITVKETDGEVELQVGSSTLATEVKQDEIITEQQQLEIIQNSIHELIARLDFLPAVRGIAADLRVTLLSGTVTTLSNQTSIGGYTASTQIPNLNNINTVLSNINNIGIV